MGWKEVGQVSRCDVTNGMYWFNLKIPQKQTRTPAAVHVNWIVGGNSKAGALQSLRRKYGRDQNSSGRVGCGSPQTLVGGQQEAAAAWETLTEKFGAASPMHWLWDLWLTSPGERPLKIRNY